MAVSRSYSASLSFFSPSSFCPLCSERGPRNGHHSSYLAIESQLTIIEYNSSCKFQAMDFHRVSKAGVSAAGWANLVPIDLSCLLLQEQIVTISFDLLAACSLCANSQARTGCFTEKGLDVCFQRQSHQVTALLSRTWLSQLLATCSERQSRSCDGKTLTNLQKG